MENISNKKFVLAAPDAIIVISHNRKIITFNEAAERITGYKTNDIIDTDFQILFRNSDQDIKYILSSLDENKSHVNITLNLTTSKYTVISVMAIITPIIQPNANLLGIILVLRDMQEMVSLQDSLQQVNRKLLIERNRLDSVFNNINEGIFTIDLDKKITSFNDAAETITGYKRDEAIGREYWLTMQYLKKEFQEFCQSELDKQKPIKNIELVIIRKDELRIHIRLSIARLLTNNGEVSGCVFSFQDISELMNLTSHLDIKYHFDNIIGHSKQMQKVYNLMDSVANSKTTVLVTGESGTGKELVARALHLHSDNKGKPFIAVNCGAFVETLLESELFGHEKGAFTGAIRSKPGRFEMANGGTIFLDEIGELSRELQVKLLRVLDNREFERVGGTETIKFDARIITATNKNLENEILKDRFREDLFYRINVLNIHLPPLKDRIDDISLLVEYFLKKFRRQFNKDIRFLSSNVLRIFKIYEWPGNIRELENVIEHTFVVCNTDTIRMDSLPEKLWLDKSYQSKSSSSNTNSSLLDAEKSVIENTLNKHKGHRGKTAEELNMDRSTLWRKIKKYNL